MKLQNNWCSNPKFYTVPEVEVITTLEELAAFYNYVKGRDIAYDLETGGLSFWTSPIICFSFSVERGKAFVLPLYHQFLKPFWEDETPILETIKRVLEDSTTEKIGYNIKFDNNFCRHRGIRVAGPIFDGIVSFGLLDENSPKDLMTAADRFNVGPYGKWDDDILRYVASTNPDYTLIPDDALWLYTGIDAAVTFQLRNKQRRAMRKDDVYHIFTDISSPLLEVVTDMEYEGVKIDVLLLEQYSNEYAGKIDAKLVEIRKRVNDDAFNPASPKQLAEKLAVSLQGGKKTATGRLSTDEKVLSALAKTGNKVAENILEYRGLSKIRSTYMEGFKELLDESGYIHTNYSIAHTVTGRISSSHPNLQNIPRVREGEANIRALFTVEEDEVFVSADYAQMELRIIGLLSGDKELLGIFERGEDIHRNFAALAYKKDPADITHEERAKAKSIAFGSNYGQEAATLAENFGLSVSEAQFLIDRYFAVFPNMTKWREKTWKESLKTHLLITPFGRKRRFIGYKFLQSEDAIPILKRFEIKAVLQNMRNQSYNFKVQSTASDYLSIATYNIYKEMKVRNLKSKVIMSVHDAINLKVKKSELSDVTSIIEKNMKKEVEVGGNVVNLGVDIQIGSGWETE